VRTIDWNAPLSDEDRAWAVQRSPKYDKQIEANDAQFAGKAAEVESDEDEGPIDEYDKWKVDELRAEAASREPAVDLTGITLKADIIAALRTWDAEYPDAE
jgi:hypothetical protein